VPMKKQDTRTHEERMLARKAFEVSMRQAVMEFDALDTSGGETDGGDGKLDFREFSRLIREREMGIHTEYALSERFAILDADGSGELDLAEFITFALRDAFLRSAANLEDLFSDWDKDGDGTVDPAEFRKVVRHYGFTADDSLIDVVFNNLDLTKQGVLVMRDLAERLQLEVRERKRPLHQLRCLAWREQAKVETIDAAALQLDPSAPVGDQIMAVLRAQSARVMDLFRSWDTDGDGLISKQEFRQCISVLGFLDVPRADADALFEMIDEDGSGEIDYNEMKEAIDPSPKQPDAVEVIDPLASKGWSALAKRAAAITLSDRSKQASIVKNIRLSPDYDIIAQLTSGIASNWAKLGWLFDKWDLDQSHSLSRAEIRRALSDLGLGSNPKAIDAFFDAMDADKSGEVSFEEFQLAIRAPLRAAKSEQLRLAAAGGGANFKASLGMLNQTRDTCCSNYTGSTMPSPRNRVGRVGGFKSARQRCRTLPPPSPALELPRQQLHAPTDPPPSPPQLPPISRMESEAAATGRSTYRPPARIQRPAMRTGPIDTDKVDFGRMGSPRALPALKASPRIY